MPLCIESMVVGLADAVILITLSLQICCVISGEQLELRFQGTTKQLSLTCSSHLPFQSILSFISARVQALVYWPPLRPVSATTEFRSHQVQERSMQILSESLPSCLNSEIWLSQTQKDEVGSIFVLIQNSHRQWAVCSSCNWASLDGK